MTIHPLFTRPRPATAPLLFPVGKYARIRMAEERHDAFQIHDKAACNPRNCRASREELITRQYNWIGRLNARIAQVVS